MLSLVCGVVIVWFGARLLTVLDRRGWDLVLGVGLLASFPCLLISSYGVEADIVLAAVMVVFAYYCVRWWRCDERGTLAVLRLGALAGLAIATKYQGLAAVVTVGVLFGHQGAIRPAERRRVVALGAPVSRDRLRHRGLEVHRQPTALRDGMTLRQLARRRGRCTSIGTSSPPSGPTPSSGSGGRIRPTGCSPISWSTGASRPPCTRRRGRT